MNEQNPPVNKLHRTVQLQSHLVMLPDQDSIYAILY